MMGACFVHWDGVHIKNIGKEAAFLISLMKVAKEADLVFSNHTALRIDKIIAPDRGQFPECFLGPAKTKTRGAYGKIVLREVWHATLPE